MKSNFALKKCKIMYSGKYIFSQLLDFVNKYEFEKCVKRHYGDFRTRDLNCWNQFIQLFFGQITLRDIFEVSALEIANLYKNRWQIEVF